MPWVFINDNLIKKDGISIDTWSHRQTDKQTDRQTDMDSLHLSQLYF